MAFEVGDSIGGHRILAELGRGGAATVYRVRREAPPDGTAPVADDHPRPAEYALKLLDGTPGRGPDAAPPAARAARREAALLAGVSHPSLVAVHEVGDHAGRPYLVMDLVSGQSLTQLLRDGGPLPPDRAVALGTDLAEALVALHRRGLVHRDLKPDNIMIALDGRARLIDFGLVERQVQATADTVAGTLLYAAPEQSGLIHRAPDHRCDLYSLGAVLFECLTGQPPFRSDDVAELLRLHATAAVPDLARLVPDVPAGLPQLVVTLLAKDPDDRYDDAERVAADLARVGTGTADGWQPRRVAPRWAAARARRTPLCGRQEQVEQVTQRWEAARAGAGGTLTVRGATGSGKSGLALELAARAEGQGCLVLQGRCEAGDAVPFAPLRSALARHVADALRLPDDERQAVAARLAEAAGSRAPLLATVAPNLPQLLGTATPPAAPDGEAPETELAGGGQDGDLFDLAVVDVLIGLARAHGGLLLVLEDAHSLDPASTRVLARLASELQSVPLLALYLARTDAARTDAARTDAARTDADPLPCAGRHADVLLEPLTDEAVAELVRAAVPGAEPGPRLTELIVGRSRGVPLVAHEYLHAIVDAGLLTRDRGRWYLDEAGLAALDLPDDAIGLVLARLSGVTPTTRDVLRTAAVTGARIGPELLREAHGADAATVLAALDEATTHGLVERADGGGHRFVHDAVRRALLAAVHEADARAVHRRIVAVLEAEPEPPGGHPAERAYTLARHHLAAGADDDPGPAFEACWAAGRTALREFGPVEAVRFLDAAAAIAGGSAAAGAGSAFPLDRGVALYRSGAFVEARQVLEAALSAAGDPLARADLDLALSDTHRSLWDNDASIAAARDGLAALGAPLPAHPLRLLLSALVRFALASVMIRTGWRRGTARGAERERFRRIAHLHGSIGLTALLDDDVPLLGLMTLRGQYWANQLGSGPEYTSAQAGLGFMLTQARLLRPAARAADRVAADPYWQEPRGRAMLADALESAPYFAGLDDGERFGAALLEHGAWMDTALYRDGCDVLAMHEAGFGRTGAAQEWLRLSDRRIGPSADVARGPYHCLTEAVVESQAGRLARAAQLLRQADAEALPAGPRSMTVKRTLAELAVLHEQAETGEPFERAVAAFEELGVRPAALARMQRVVYHHLAAGRLAQARAAQGEERARRLAQAAAALKLLRRFRRDADLRALADVTGADLLLLRGDPGAALRALGEADAATGRDVPVAAFEAARVRARALAALGREQDAARQARLARAVAVDQGWPHRAGWVDAEFGTRPRGGAATATTGPASTGAAARAGASLPGAAGNGPLPGSSSAGPSPASASVARVSRAAAVTAPRDRQRLQALQQVSIAASRVVDPEELARISLDHTIRILAAERAFLFLTDDAEGLVPFLGRTAEGQDVARLTGYAASLVERVHASGEPLVVAGTEEGAALGARSVLLHGLRSVLVAPLTLEHRRLGVVYLDSQLAKGIFTADDVDILTALTTHIATSLETARAAQLEISVRTAQRERDLADQLRAASQALAEAPSPAAVLARLVEQACTIAGCDAGAVVVRGPDGVRLHQPEGPPAGTPVPVDAPLQALLAAQQPLAGTPRNRPQALRSLLADRAWVAIPLRGGELDAGTLVLRSAEPAGGPSGALSARAGAASALASHAVTAFERASLFARVQALAVADELTGLANRRHFFDVAHRDVGTCLRAGRPLAALMLDIDHFKAINDTHGHATGDDVIQSVAQRLAAQLRDTDLLGRYGGEEFVVLVPDATDALEVAERLRAAVAEPEVPTRSGPVRVTISIGVTHLTPSDDITSLLSRADEALYRAKAGGRNRVADGTTAAAFR